MIAGVETKALTAISDERGFLMEILRSDEPIFDQFGQVYITGCKFGIAKAWHYHKKQTDHFACVLGKALVVLYDNREQSPSHGEVQEFVLEGPPAGGSSLMLVKIPPLVLHGFTSLEAPEARILNVPTLPYRRQAPDEYRFPWNSQDIPYCWPDAVRAGG